MHIHTCTYSHIAIQLISLMLHLELELVCANRTQARNTFTTQRETTTKKTRFVHASTHQCVCVCNSPIVASQRHHIIITVIATHTHCE